MQAIMIQAIGFVGVAFFVLSYLIKSNRALFLMQLLGTSLFCCQFLLLGAYSGAANLVVIIVRNALLMNIRTRAWIRSKWTMLGVLVLAGVGAAISWQGWISLLPLAAVLATTIAYWTDNAQKIRLGSLVCGSPCWLVYDLLVGSWAGVLNESITLASIFVSIYRFGWKNMGDPNAGF